MYFIILILIFYFFFLLIKYSGTEKPEYNLDYFRDTEFIKYSPIIVGYLNSGKIKEQHFIATTLHFVTKGYITVEKTSDNSDYIFKVVKKIEATELEKEALSIFFNHYPKRGRTQTLKQFKKIMKIEKFFGHYGKLKRIFNTKIRDYFDKKEDIKKITLNANKKNMILCYFLFIITCYILNFPFNYAVPFDIIQIFILNSIFYLLFIFVLSFIKFSLLGNFAWILAIIVTFMYIQLLSFLSLFICMNNLPTVLLVLLLMSIVILFDDMLQRKKTNLANAHEMIKGLKKYITNHSNIDEYDLYNIYLWNEYYVYAVALDIKKI